MKRFIIQPNDANQRMDKFLTKAVPLLPKSLLYKYLRTKRIKCNGKRCEISTRLQQGDVVELYINDEFFAPADALLAFLRAGSMPELVYEDENLLLVNKPAGLVVHEDESGTPDTLINRVLKYLYEKGEYRPEQEASFTPALCNRIDRNTSGIVLCAKNAEALRVLNEKIKLHQMDKYYRCIVHGTPKPASARVTLYMTKDSEEKKIHVYKKPVPDGRSMITEYQTLCSAQGYSLLEVHLITGRTHQIRATMHYLGHPLVGEGKYGTAANRLGFSHQALCAYAVSFSFTGEPTFLDYLSGKRFCLKEEPFIQYFPAYSQK